MKHFSTEEWIDFMNLVTPDGQRVEMQEHLRQGCERCSQELRLWEKVRSVGTMEDSLEPPSEMVRWVKASYGAAARMAPKTKGSLVEVLFDSFLQPAIAGARSTANGNRQMLYRADSYQIDIQVELKPGTNLVVIAGQIMDVANAAAAGERIPEFGRSGIVDPASGRRRDHDFSTQCVTSIAGRNSMTQVTLRIAQVFPVVSKYHGKLGRSDKPKGSPVPLAKKEEIYSLGRIPFLLTTE